MIDSYDEQIAQLEDELEGCGVRVERTIQHNEIGVKAYNFLLENPGKRYQGKEIMQRSRALARSRA